MPFSRQQLLARAIAFGVAFLVVAIVFVLFNAPACVGRYL